MPTFTVGKNPRSQLNTLLCLLLLKPNSRSHTRRVSYQIFVLRLKASARGVMITNEIKRSQLRLFVEVAGAASSEIARRAIVAAKTRQVEQK